MKYVIAPSILSADLACLGAEVEAVLGKRGPAWTKGATLPGGDFPTTGFDDNRGFPRGDGGSVGGYSQQNEWGQDDWNSRQPRDPVAQQRDDFFARKQAENAHRPDNLPPSQGGKYSGFGSSSSFASAQSQPLPQRPSRQQSVSSSEHDEWGVSDSEDASAKASAEDEWGDDDDWGK